MEEQILDGIEEKHWRRKKAKLGLVEFGEESEVDFKIMTSLLKNTHTNDVLQCPIVF